ncbi:MAG: molybdenum cofactor biosynthesis protein B [Haloarculaceae archaeon]
MVDFQSRDTGRRGGTDDASEDADDADHGDDEHDHGDGHGHDHEDHGHDHDHEDHGHHQHDVETLSVAILTISSSRTRENDPSGDAIEELAANEGHDVVTREIVGDDYDVVQQSLDALAGRSDVDVIVTTGGTGVTPDDVTVEAATPLFDKELPGFGERFRALSVEDIGSRVVATRATAGVVDGVPVFCLPGSESAVRLGTEEIILDVAGHVAGLARRD